MQLPIVNPVDFIMNTLMPSGKKSALINEEEYMTLIDMLNPYVYAVAKMHVVEDYAVGLNDISFNIENNGIYIDEYGDYVFAFKRIDDTVYVRKMKIDVINTISFVQ